MAKGWTDSSNSSPSSEWRFLDTRSMARARPSRTLISLLTLACWRWNSSSFFSSSTASMSASSLCMISRSSSFSMRSLSRCSRCIFTFSISLSRSSCRRFSAFKPSSLGSTPLTRDFSIFLCHTNRSVRLASPKGFTLSVYPAISPCFSRAASFLVIFAARCLRCSSLFSVSESEESDEDEWELDGSRLDLFFFDLLLDFFSFFSFLDFFSFLALFASLPGAPSLLLPGMGKPCAAALALAIAPSLRALSSLMIASSSSALATALNAAPSHASDLLGEVPFSFSRNPSCPHLSSVDPASILAVSFPWSVSILSDGRGPPHLRQLSLNLKFSAPQPHFQSFFLAASSSLSR
mmetsp:Transcript_14339/g.60657  ORF Transcript_14339/g.60657 Transcript_14339/m.60657 type:complete len:350 (-) Transcript_14339:371-1420(-)